MHKRIYIQLKRTKRNYLKMEYAKNVLKEYTQ